MLVGIEAGKPRNDGYVEEKPLLLGSGWYLSSEKPKLKNNISHEGLQQRMLLKWHWTGLRPESTWSWWVPPSSPGTFSRNLRQDCQLYLFSALGARGPLVNLILSDACKEPPWNLIQIPWDPFYTNPRVSVVKTKRSPPHVLYFLTRWFFFSRV